MSKRGASFKYLLGIDCETTGVAGGCDDPSFNPHTDTTYQAISWGVVVVDVKTLDIVDRLYVEIKWDGQSAFEQKTVAVHGLSKEHLENHGMDEEEAVVEIGSFIFKYFADMPICTIGHNVHFDIWFLRRLFRKYNIDIRFANRHVDTNALGMVLLDTFTSDEMFDAVGLPARAAHNALEDIEHTVRTAKILKQLFTQHVFGE